MIVPYTSLHPPKYCVYISRSSTYVPTSVLWTRGVSSVWVHWELHPETIPIHIYSSPISRMENNSYWKGWRPPYHRLCEVSRVRMSTVCHLITHAEEKRQVRNAGGSARPGHGQVWLRQSMHCPGCWIWLHNPPNDYLHARTQTISTVEKPGFIIEVIFNGKLPSLFSIPG